MVIFFVRVGSGSVNSRFTVSMKRSGKAIKPLSKLAGPMIQLLGLFTRGGVHGIQRSLSVTVTSPRLQGISGVCSVSFQSGVFPTFTGGKVATSQVRQ